MSYETESNKNGISKATNKLFFGSKLKKPTKNNEFSLTITIDEETESHLRTSFKISNT